MTMCDFCAAFGGGADPEFMRRAGPGTTRVLQVTESVAVFPSLGPLSSLHALVSPIRHVLSTAAAGEEVSTSVWQVAEALRTGLAAQDADAVLFEHGLSNGGGPGCGVSHAHVHVAAVPSASRLRVPAGPWLEHDGDRRTLRVNADAEHLIIGLAPHRWAVRYQRRVPSQYLRRWIASELACTNWDWREPSGRDKGVRTQRKVIEQLLRHHLQRGAAA
jgi:diadenosine tetraphosphate (Ap4A) HIT family hydrolase